MVGPEIDIIPHAVTLLDDSFRGSLLSISDGMPSLVSGSVDGIAISSRKLITLYRGSVVIICDSSRL